MYLANIIGTSKLYVSCITVVFAYVCMVYVFRAFTTAVVGKSLIKSRSVVLLGEMYVTRSKLGGRAEGSPASN